MQVTLSVVRGILLAGLTLIATLAVGCGGRESSLDGALSYLSADAPLVVTIDTDVDGDQVKNLESLARATPGWELVKRQVLAIAGLDERVFTGDIKPWLGNEMVIGAASVSGLSSGQTVSVLEATDDKALYDFAADSRKSGFEPAGDYRGARLYTKFEGGLTVAIDEDVILMSATRKAIEKAIDTNRSGTVFDREKITVATGESSPRLATLYLDMQQLISKTRRQDGAKDLSKVAWLSALTTLGVSADADRDELAFDIRLDSSGRDLSPADIPIATGRKSPQLLAVKGGYFSAGLRDLTQPIHFAEDVARALDPSAYKRYGQAKQVIGRMFGVDIDQDVIDQLGGDTAIVAGRSGVGAKIDIESPGRMQRSLGQTIPVITSFLMALDVAEQPEIVHRRVGRTVIYEVRDGRRLMARYGVLGNVLAIGVGRTNPFDIKTRKLKREDAGSERGSMVASVDVGSALDTLLKDQVPALVLSYLDFLRVRVSGSVQATTKLIKGRITYSFG